MTRRLLILALTVAASPAGFGQVEYELYIVSPFNPGTSEAYVYDVNDSGMAVGMASASTYHGFYWTETDGKIDIGVGRLDGINSSGVAVGNALRWSDPTTSTVIPAPDSYYGTVHAFDISDNDVVVGEAVHLYQSSYSIQTAIVWDAVNGTRDLSALGVPSAYEAFSVNDLGQIVGTTNTTGSYGNTRGFLFDLGTGEYLDLGSLHPNDQGTVAAFDINAEGVVVGDSSTPGFGTGDHAFRWTITAGMEDLGVIGVYQSGGFALNDSSASGVNDLGVIVGRSTVANSASSWDARHAFVWDETQGMRDLNDLVDAPADYYLIDAKAISNTGWICGVGFGSAGGGLYSGFVLKPIAGPPPVEFVRGDGDGDGTFHGLLDGVFMLSYQFDPGNPAPPCMAAADVNGDQVFNGLTDGLTALFYQFIPGSPPPAPPFPDCGTDVDTVAILGCDSPPTACNP